MSGLPNRTGVMLVGCLGMTASAVVAGAQAVRSGVIDDKAGVTSHPAFRELPLPATGDLVFSGWDFHRATVQEQLLRHDHLPESVIAACTGLDHPQSIGIHTALDFPVDAGGVARATSDVEEGVHFVEEDVTAFRRFTGVDMVVVVYLGSPSRKPPADTLRRAISGRADDIPSALIYAAGAARARAHFVDFTPSPTLEYPQLWRLADECGVQLSGRDGSTGQTMMKVHVSELLAMRGIAIDSWYSTNIIGNRDGRVLNTEGFRETKLEDKFDAVPLDSSRHRVAIEYLPSWGDRKESWDAVEATTWLGGELSLRINWRGSDSELAAQFIIDLVRLISYGEAQGRRGFQPQLGFFYKRPFKREHTTLSERWRELVDAYVGGEV